MAESIVVEPMKGVWLLNGKGVAHCVVGKKALCRDGGFPKGKKVPAPVDADSKTHCYNCQYIAIFNTLPKWYGEALTKLLNREITSKIHADREDTRKNYEIQEKHLASQREEANKRDAEIQTRYQEAKKLKEGAEKDKDATELGRATIVLLKALAREKTEAEFDIMRSERGRRMW